MMLITFPVSPHSFLKMRPSHPSAKQNYLATTTDLIPRVELGQHNIILNVPHPSLLLHIHDKTARSVFILLTQKSKETYRINA
jgi:hypothetical protein